jgi:hypothetical protein
MSLFIFLENTRSSVTNGQLLESILLDNYVEMFPLGLIFLASPCLFLEEHLPTLLWHGP